VQYAMTAVFLVGMLGMDFLLPKSLAEYSVAARILVGMLMTVTYLVVLVRYCRCPKYDQHPGPKGPRIDARRHVRQSAHFDMENWEACCKCGTDLR
jgi:hypothetical protein